MREESNFIECLLYAILAACLVYYIIWRVTSWMIYTIGW